MIIALGEGFEIVDNGYADYSPTSGIHSKQALSSFKLVFPSGSSKEFLFAELTDKLLWIKALSGVLGYFNIDQMYTVTHVQTSLSGDHILCGFSRETEEAITIVELTKRPDPPLPSQLAL